MGGPSGSGPGGTGSGTNTASPGGSASPGAPSGASATGPGTPAPGGAIIQEVRQVPKAPPVADSRMDSSRNPNMRCRLVRHARPELLCACPLRSSAAALSKADERANGEP